MKTVKQDGQRTRVQTIFTKKTRTQQQFKDMCDANRIVKRYQQTGELLHVNRKAGVYADISNITDYHSSLQKVLDANNAFLTLPSDLRARFKNDPEELLKFLHDPKNHDEGVELGLFEAKPEPKSKEIIKTNEPNEQKNISKKPKQLDLEKPEPS